MAEYEIRISGVHYGANGDSVAGQKDTEEMHMRTRELLSRIDRVRPIVTLSPDPSNPVHESVVQTYPHDGQVHGSSCFCHQKMTKLLCLGKKKNEFLCIALDFL